MNLIPTTVVIDSGSGTSTIGSNFFENYLIGDVNLEKSESMSIAANGQEITTRGEVIIPISFQDFTMIHKFRVVDELGNEILIGSDFLKEANAKIDFKNVSVKF